MYIFKAEPCGTHTKSQPSLNSFHSSSPALLVALSSSRTPSPKLFRKEKKETSDARLQGSPPARERSGDAGGSRSNHKNSAYQEKQRLWSTMETHFQLRHTRHELESSLQQDMRRAHNTNVQANWQTPGTIKHEVTDLTSS